MCVSVHTHLSTRIKDSLWSTSSKKVLLSLLFLFSLFPFHFVTFKGCLYAEFHVPCSWVDYQDTWVLEMFMFIVWCPLSSADFTITPLVLELSLIRSHFLWGEFSACSAANVIHNVQIFVPPGTHHWQLGRGSMKWEVYPTLPHMTSSGNQTLDLLLLSPTPYPLKLWMSTYWESSGKLKALRVAKIIMFNPYMPT